MDEDDKLILDKEYQAAYTKVQRAVLDYAELYQTDPTHIYVSDKEELQSMMMLVADHLGYQYERTGKETHCTSGKA